MNAKQQRQLTSEQVTDQELSLALSLRQQGCSWANIAIGLGHSPGALVWAYRRRQKEE